MAREFTAENPSVIYLKAIDKYGVPGIPSWDIRTMVLDQVNPVIRGTDMIEGGTTHRLKPRNWVRTGSDALGPLTSCEMVRNFLAEKLSAIKFKGNIDK